MSYKKINIQTGEVTVIPLTAEEIAERESYKRDVLPGILLKQSKQNRADAYRTEADPLFFQYQAGEVTKEEWLAKREEIRARYPYPTA